ncbi:BrnA antitoxin family protein [Litoreibacter ponti]|nr:BrnA antitoxin family protein [Litoreibacter ponti]
MTKRQRLARQKMSYYMWLAKWEDEISLNMRDVVPQAWHRLEHDLDVQEPKKKITLRLDKLVANFYRAMGHGYQARINRILATYAHMKIADALKQDHSALEFLEQMHGLNKARPGDIPPGAREEE